MLRRLFVMVVLATIVAGCNSNSTNVPFPTLTPVPTASPVPIANASGTLTTSTTLATSLTLGPIGTSGSTLVGTTSCTPTSNVATLSIVFSQAQPAGTPTVAWMRRRPANIGGANIVPFGFFTLTPNVNVTCP